MRFYKAFDAKTGPRGLKAKRDDFPNRISMIFVFPGALANAYGAGNLTNIRVFEKRVVDFDAPHAQCIRVPSALGMSQDVGSTTSINY